MYRARGINHDYGAVRAGLSFYESDDDETQPWLIVEARRVRGLSSSTEITPMLRFINNYIDAGISTSKQAHFNLMCIFEECRHNIYYY